ncbi:MULTISPECIES: tripartite tricarboxylate transporter TctB family protein [Neorhizobium]|uniref:tripartite tricarboxylate transporter TctB family protein n=1 Tax=Neorhizobium TaxID=1525371 RepID=UPI000CFA19DE|nr:MULTISPECIES: tripartite tricarboxylate transporter TctB family protein [Neorhizobium]
MKALSIDVAGGLCLIALASIALWLLRDLPQGTLDNIGPAMLPRWMAVGFGAIGIGMSVRGLRRPGERLGKIGLRSPIFLAGAIVFFAATINQVGLALAGPLTMVIAGLASSNTRWHELLLFSLVMTALSIALFRYTLNVQLPVLTLPGLVYL